MSGGRGGVFVGMVEGYGRRLAAVVALLMAWTLAVTLLEVIAESPAQAAPEAPASAGDPAALQRPDVVSAMVTAQMLDKRVEVTGLRTETSLTYAHPDGTYSSEINARPVRVEQPDGTWRAVDTDLHRTPDGHVAPAETPVQVELSGDTAAATPALASLADDGKSASIGWSGKLPEPTLDGDTAVYTNVLPDVDLELRATAEGFAKLIIVKTPAAAAALGATVRLPLSGKGVMFSLGETGALLAKDSKGRVVFTAPAPIMWDSTTDEGTGEATRQAPVG
ncbi:MAG TPA: hypothetical protein VGO94_14565, partial [Mycobacteriales bacterium]|nr:hypothetical protein [Mycobacteriales bacterium]